MFEEAGLSVATVVIQLPSLENSLYLLLLAAATTIVHTLLRVSLMTGKRPSFSLASTFHAQICSFWNLRVKRHDAPIGERKITGEQEQ